MSEGPTWIVTDPAKPYPDRRFDGVTLPPTFRAVVDVEPNITAWTDNNERLFHLLRRDDGSICLYYTRPNNPAQVVVWDSLDAGWNLQPPASPDASTPQQPTPEQIADAARLAADDIALVFRLWPYGNLDPLGSLRMLHLLLTPPAPKWTATEDE